MNELLTIFTPTYNRAALLFKLWRSLCAQTNKDFVWLIIDDGSSDDTGRLVSSWQKQSAFTIIYVYQKNSGKHIAHNEAVKRCKTSLFICVDSDDLLIPNAVALIHSYWKESRGKGSNVVGWCARRGDLREKPVNDANWPHNEPEVSFVDLYEKIRFRGETALIWRTDALKQYHFPVVTSEKFVTEQVLYYQLSFTEKLKLKNDIFYLFKYQDDGYTKQGLQLNIKNPIGTAISYKVQYAAANSSFYRLKKLLKYKAWCQYFQITDAQVLGYFENLKYEHSLLRVNKIIDKITNLIVFIAAPVIKWRLKQ